jgi:SMI1/KNR4 family protein SUKH-1
MPSDEFDWRAELELVAPDVMLPPGCRAQAIAAAEGSLGLPFPAEQVEFLKATDGVYDGESHHWFAWSLERVVDENFESDRPSDLLIVGDDGASGWFCLPLEGGGVVYYARTTGERRLIAPDVRGLWLGWFGGTICA